MMQLVPTMRVAAVGDKRVESIKSVPASEPAPANVPTVPSGWHWFRMSALAGAGVICLGFGVSRVSPRYVATTAFDRVVETTAETAKQPVLMGDITSDLLRREVIQAVAWDLGRGGPELDLNKLQRELSKQVRATVEQTSSDIHRVNVVVKHKDPKVARVTADALVSRYFEAEKGRDERAQIKLQLTQAEANLQAARDNEAFEQTQLQKVEKSRASINEDDIKRDLLEICRAIDQAVSKREAVKTAIADLTRDLPATPALVHTNRNENDTVAQKALRKLVKDREEYAEQLSEQHPTVVSLDRRIRKLADQCGIENPRVLLSQRSREDDDRSEESAELRVRLRGMTERLADLKREEQRLSGQLQRVEKMNLDLREQQDRSANAKVVLEKMDQELTQLQAKLASMGGSVGLQRVVLDEGDVARSGPNRLMNFSCAAFGWISLIGLLGYWTSPRRRMPQS